MDQTSCFDREAFDPVRAERREHRRFGRQARCWCQHPRASQYVTILNASLGGLFVKTHTPFAAGEVMEVLWSAEPGKPNLRAVAKVVWRRGTGPSPGMGLAFVSLPAETEDELKKKEETP